MMPMRWDGKSRATFCRTRFIVSTARPAKMLDSNEAFQLRSATPRRGGFFHSGTPAMFHLTGHVTTISIDPSIRCTQFRLNVLSQQSL
jgi:hypothetical protein